MSAPLAATRRALAEYGRTRRCFHEVRNRALATITETVEEAVVLGAEWTAAEAALNSARAAAVAACESEALRNVRAARARWMHRAQSISAGCPA